MKNIKGRNENRQESGGSKQKEEDGRKKRQRRKQINTQKKTQQLQYRQIDREDDIKSQVLVEFRT
jgi:hypothetical protein